MTRNIPILVPSGLAERWVAAVGRARAQRVRTWLTQKGWKARRAGGNVYILYAYQLRDGALGIVCSCPGFKYTQVCKHAARLALRLHRRGLLVRLLTTI